MFASAKQYAQQQTNQNLALRQEIQRRNITLVHFTHIGNLGSICRNGLLLRTELEAKDMDYVATDNHRYDTHSDALCLSVSFPNYAMFYKKRQQIAPDQNWVVIELNPMLLLEMPALFWPTNAASRQCRGFTDNQLTGLAGFNSMFDDATVRGQLKMPDCIPTDPQAEIQILERIDPKWIQRVCTVDNASGLRAQCAVSGRINVAVCDGYFQPRYDFRYWKKY